MTEGTPEASTHGAESSRPRAADAAEARAAMWPCDPFSALVGLLDHSEQAIKICDLDGRVLAWNAASERLFETSADEVCGQCMPDLPEEDRLGAVKDLRAVAAGGVPVHRAVECRRKDGSTLLVELTVVPVFDECGDASGILSIAHEIGRDSRFDGTAEDFIAAVARELTSPLTALQGAAQLLATPDVGEDPIGRARVARVIEHQCRELSELTEGLLFGSGVVGEKVTVDDQPCDLTRLVNRVAAKVGDQYPSCAVFVAEAPTSFEVRADSMRLEEALANLVLVAAEGEEAVSRVNLRVYADGDHAVVQAERETPARDRTRASTTTRVPDKPIGLGARLMFIRRIAEAHGGSFAMTRSGTSGSMLSLRLPRLRPTPETA